MLSVPTDDGGIPVTRTRPGGVAESSQGTVDPTEPLSTTSYSSATSIEAPASPMTSLNTILSTVTAPASPPTVELTPTASLDEEKPVTQRPGGVVASGTSPSDPTNSVIPTAFSTEEGNVPATRTVPGFPPTVSSLNGPSTHAVVVSPTDDGVLPVTQRPGGVAQSTNLPSLPSATNAPVVAPTQSMALPASQFPEATAAHSGSLAPGASPAAKSVLDGLIASKASEAISQPTQGAVSGPGDEVPPAGGILSQTQDGPR